MPAHHISLTVAYRQLSNPTSQRLKDRDMLSAQS